MQSPNNICFGCDHFCSNNSDRLVRGCRAFPDGIPYKYGLGKEHFHDKVLDGQVEDFVYTPAKIEVNNMDQDISIYQNSNPYTDENGRYTEKSLRPLREITKDNVTEEEMFRLRYEYEISLEWKEIEEKMIELYDFEKKVYTDEKYSKWMDSFTGRNQ